MAGRIPAVYVLEAGSASGLANLARFDTGAPVIGLSLGAPPGQFYVRLRARDGCGLSRPSNEIVVTVSTDGPPGAPLWCYRHRHWQQRAARTGRRQRWASRRHMCSKPGSGHRGSRTSS